MSKDLTGTTLGKYQVIERLGRGGMADVYRAFQPGMERVVALKVMHGHLAQDPNFITRFKREAQSVGTLRHPNIVQVIDFDVQDDEYYMVMEYIQGETLKAILQRRGPLPIGEALSVLSKLTDAVAYAHGEGMIHRDIKPANVMFTKTGNPILTDFGIARIMDASGITVSGAFIGTPAYISPEAGRGEKVDERADIYSLGIVLYEMLTGTVPYDADTPYAVIMKHISAPLPPPRQFVANLPESVEKLVLKALAKDPAERYQSAVEFRDAVERVRANLPTELPTTRGQATATPAQPTVVETAQSARGSGRNTTVLAIGAVVVVGVILGAIVLFSRPQPPTPTGTPGATVTTPVAAVVTDISGTQSPTTAASATSGSASGVTSSGQTTAVGSTAVAASNAKYAALMEQVKAILIEGAPNDALELVDKALASDPQSYDLLALRGRVHMERGREYRDQAKADADAAIKIDPNRPEAYITLGQYYLYPDTDDSDEIVASLKNAVTNYTQAITRGSQDYYAYWGRATANSVLNGYVGSSNNVPIGDILKDMDRAAAFSPKDPRLYMARGEFYFYETNYSEALKSFEQAVALHPTYTDYHSAVAGCYILLGQPEKALPLYTKTIDQDKTTNTKYMADGAYVAWASKKKDIARKWAQQALTIEPNTPAATYVLALMDAEDRKFDDALKKLDEIAKITENTWAYDQPFLNRRYGHRVLLHRARILASAGRLEEAIAAYGLAIEQDNDWTLLLIERARLYQQQGKITEARNDLRLALELATNNKEEGQRNEILDMLGRLATEAAGTAAPQAPASSATPG